MNKLQNVIKWLFRCGKPKEKEETEQEKALRLEAEKIKKSFPNDIQFPLK